MSKSTISMIIVKLVLCVILVVNVCSHIYDYNIDIIEWSHKCDYNLWLLHVWCHNPTLRKCEDETHILEIGTWESFGTPKILKFDCMGPNTLHWGVLYIIGKPSKFRCWKWVCMGHLDIYSTCYGKKKGRESNWQFDSQPLKVRNRPDPGACKWSAIHCWKALKESYKFALNLIPIGGLSKELRPHKVARV